MAEDKRQCMLCLELDATSIVNGEAGEEYAICTECVTYCEECNSELDLDNVYIVKLEQHILPGGWIFAEPGTEFKKEEYLVVYCGYCRDMVCRTHKSMNCPSRCENCSHPCSDECECENLTVICQS
jgi:hypothetical protein